MSTSAQTIWLFAIVEPADPLTIPPLPISIADTRQKRDPATVVATTRVAERKVRAASGESIS
jgi:hypothetical protein